MDSLNLWVPTGGMFKCQGLPVVGFKKELDIKFAVVRDRDEGCWRQINTAFTEVKIVKPTKQDLQTLFEDVIAYYPIGEVFEQLKKRKLLSVKW